jgi:uncharacterized protein (DUF433 family)
MKEDTQIYQERMVAVPRLLAGKAVVKGTRISVEDVQAFTAACSSRFSRLSQETVA